MYNTQRKTIGGKSVDAVTAAKLICARLDNGTVRGHCIRTHTTTLLRALRARPRGIA